MKSNKAFIITGPSAVGKTTIARELLKTDLPLARVITTTTREIRDGEVQDHSYHFVTKPEFKRMIENDEMAEWATYNDNYYGSQKRDVDEIFASGRHPLWVVDVQGADFFQTQYPDAKVLFVTPSSFEILRKRLEKRALPEPEIRSRLKIARAEMLKAPEFDYRVTNYDGRLANVVEEARAIIERELQ